MGFNIGLSFFIHLMIVLVFFIFEFLDEIWHSPVIRYGIIVVALILELLYFALRGIFSF